MPEAAFCRSLSLTPLTSPTCKFLLLQDFIIFPPRQDIRVQSKNQFIYASVGESEEKIAQCTLGLAHKNASREGEDATICYFLWRFARDISNLRRVM